MLKIRNESLEPVFDAVNGFNIIDMKQFQNNGSDNIVQSRTQSATGGNGAFKLTGVKIYFFPGACLIKTDNFLSVLIPLLKMIQLNIHNNPFFIGNKEFFTLSGLD